MEAQAATIEKLLIKVKKLKSEKLNNDYGIFNMAHEEQPQQVVSGEAYREMLGELHRLMLQQGAKEHAELATPEQQFLELKAHLSLEAQMAGLHKKWHWEPAYAKLVDLRLYASTVDGFEHNSLRSQHPSDALHYAKEAFKKLNNFS